MKISEAAIKEAADVLSGQRREAFLEGIDFDTLNGFVLMRGLIQSYRARHADDDADDDDWEYAVLSELRRRRGY